MKNNKLYISLIMLILISVLGASMIFSGCRQESTAVEENIEEAGSAEGSGIADVTPITPQEVYGIITDKEDYLILDVRNPDEYAEGHLEGAALIPVSELEGRLSELPEDKPIIVYCKSGGRSAQAANILVENGFDQIFDMGGIMDWIDDGLPIVLEVSVKTGYLTISVDESYEIYMGSEDYLFIDVRTKDEFDTSHVLGAVHIPVSEIGDRLDEVPDDIILVVYCNGSGCNRSGSASNILADNGFDQVFDMGGRGIFEWEESGYPIE